MFNLLTLYHSTTLNVHRIWTENRSSVSALLLHQSSSHFLRLRGLSSHCAGFSSFITNPTEHSPSEANKYSASPEIPCIYVIWRFNIKFQRPVHSTRSERASVHVLLWKSYKSYKAECYWDFSQTVYSAIQHAPSQHLQGSVANAADPAPVPLLLSPALCDEQVVATTSPHTAPLAALYCHTLQQQETSILLRDTYFPNMFLSYISHQRASLCNKQFYKKIKICFM